jgi:hypothetical protein
LPFCLLPFVFSPFALSLLYLPSFPAVDTQAHMYKNHRARCKMRDPHKRVFESSRQRVTAAQSANDGQVYWSFSCCFPFIHSSFSIGSTYSSCAYELNGSLARWLTQPVALSLCRFVALSLCLSVGRPAQPSVRSPISSRRAFCVFCARVLFRLLLFHWSLFRSCFPFTCAEWSE